LTGFKTLIGGPGIVVRDSTDNVEISTDDTLLYIFLSELPAETICNVLKKCMMKGRPDIVEDVAKALGIDALQNATAESFDRWNWEKDDPMVHQVYSTLNKELQNRTG